MGLRTCTCTPGQALRRGLSDPSLRSTAAGERNRSAERFAGPPPLSARSAACPALRRRAASPAGAEQRATAAARVRARPRPRRARRRPRRRAQSPGCGPGGRDRTTAACPCLATRLTVSDIMTWPLPHAGAAGPPGEGAPGHAQAALPAHAARSRRGPGSWLRSTSQGPSGSQSTYPGWRDLHDLDLDRIRARFLRNSGVLAARGAGAG